MSDYSQQRTIDPAEESQLLDAIDRWVEKEVRPIVKEYDHADRYPDELVAQMRELGLFGARRSRRLMVDLGFLRRPMRKL